MEEKYKEKVVDEDTADGWTFRDDLSSVGTTLTPEGLLSCRLFIKKYQFFIRNIEFSKRSKFLHI